MTKILIRWVSSGVGLWLASRLLESIDYGDDTGVLVAAAFVLALANTFIKPLLIFLALPALLLSLGVFMLVVNAVLLYITDYFVGDFVVSSFTGAILAAIILSIVNIAISSLAEEKK